MKKTVKEFRWAKWARISVTSTLFLFLSLSLSVDLGQGALSMTSNLAYADDDYDLNPEEEEQEPWDEESGGDGKCGCSQRREICSQKIVKPSGGGSISVTIDAPKSGGVTVSGNGNGGSVEVTYRNGCVWNPKNGAPRCTETNCAGAATITQTC